eukprot:3573642-Rhodomonas_salina.1
MSAQTSAELSAPAYMFPCQHAYRRTHYRAVLHNHVGTSSTTASQPPVQTHPSLSTCSSTKALAPSTNAP